jgi:hypothetical protein
MGVNISTPTPPGDTISTLRARAISAGDQRRTYSSQSQAAYLHGNGAEAKRLSELAKASWAEAERLNALAAEMAFKEYNPTYSASTETQEQGWLGWVWGWGEGRGAWKEGLERIDLHGLYVQEALARVEKHLKICEERGVLMTTVITGRGNRSADGLAKIKPSVEKWLGEREGRYRVSKTGNNEGAVLVEIVKEDAATKGLIKGVMSMLGW